MLKIYISLITFIFGIVLGSFYNVIGYRLPKNESILFPASNCPNCHHKLKFYELFPIISYVFLGGKCSKCKNKISIVYPLFEFLTGLLFMISYLIYDLNINFVISITFISILLIISISDLRYFIIPDQVLMIGTIFIIVELIVKTFINNISLYNGLLLPLLNGICSFFTLYLFKVVGDYIFKKESLGGGDIKLLFIFGLLIGFEMSVISIFIAAFIALPFSIIMLIKKNDNVLPFGPYLSIAAILIFLTRIDIHTILNILVK